MPDTYPCLCVATNPVLRWCRWTGILPILPVVNTANHFTAGCRFKISKFWFIWSILIQVSYAVYVSCTAIVRLYLGPEQYTEYFEWYLMTIGYLIMQIDSVISLLLGLIYCKRIGNLLERLSKINSTIKEMGKIKSELRVVLIFVFTLYLTMFASYLYIAWSRTYQFYDISLSTISDTRIGLIIRGVCGIFSQIQCALVVMLCLLISSKFQNVADTIKITMDDITFIPSVEKPKIINVKGAAVKWIATETDKSITTQLEQISDQYQETNHCLAEVNHCIGLQLLVTLSANLFIIVYYLYRYITASNTSPLINNNQKHHCIISLISLFLKLLLYMIMGQKIKTESRKPAYAMQKIKLLRLPKAIQQQLQSLILQWLSTEFGYLSAFNVINVGPWLLAPIAGNVITYLLVTMQFNEEGYDSLTMDGPTMDEDIY